MEERTDISPDTAAPQADQSRRNLLLGALFVAISAVSWGFSGTLAQYLTQVHEVRVEWLNCVRMLATAVVLLPVALARKGTRTEIREILTHRQSAIDIVVYALGGAFACQVGYLFAIAYTNSGTATMFEQLGMIIVVAVTCISMRRKPTRREVIALLLAIAGSFCICTKGNLGALVLPPQALFWGFFASVSMATYVLLPVRLLKTFSGLSVTTLAMCIAGVVITIGFQPWNCAPELNFEIVAGTAGTVLLGTLLAYLLFLEGMKLVGPIIGGLLDAIEPVTAIITSAVWLGTVVTPFDALGCAFVIGMLVLITLPEKKAAASE